MRRFAIAAVGTIFIALAAAQAGPVAPGGLTAIERGGAVVLVQDKPKNETLKQKVKRVWRNLTGYKFDVACPAFPIALTRSTCTETGKDREDARAKCQAKNMFCQVADARRKRD